ncbi:pneumococcal-type histidine triad protein [Streptococcus ruminantium]|uniref:pneumococcal-type histidine triad protein n=2 Tax=Streptococcus ruminantium TaxID=1917441 RepID=UPI00280E4BFD|nr:pneumococcal-type histidine triad protein [Streptococcus ruminantium]MDQ8836176.1 pneumococcal-type histidine triad protein [Streptococcus ruminantium]
MSELEAKISKMVVIGMPPVQPELPSQPSEPIQSDVPSQPSQPTPPTTDDDHGLVDLLGKNIKKTAKGMDGLPYTTSDGYTFTAESILEYDDQGLRAEHGDHEHYVFYHELEDSELEAAQNYINRNHLTAVKPSGYSKSEIEAKLRYVSLENGVPFDQLIVTGNQVIIPHGNHSHVGNLDRYPVALRLKNDSDVDEYRSLLVSLKMSYLRLQNEGGSVYRRNDVVVVVQKDGIEREVKLKDIRLPLDYDEVDYSGLVTAVDPNEEKLAYIAKQYGVPRHEVRYLFDNLVMIEGHGAVDLSLVNVKDAVIYSLRNQPQDTKTEEDKGDGDEKVQEQPVHTERVDSEQTLPDSTVQDEVLSTLQPEHQSEPEIDHSSSTDDGSISQPSIDSDSEEEEEIQSDEDSEELDEYELAMRERAKAYGMAADDFEEALVSIALKHSVGVESFEYQPEQKTVSFLDRSGQRQVVKVGNN